MDYSDVNRSKSKMSPNYRSVNVTPPPEIYKPNEEKYNNVKYLQK